MAVYAYLIGMVISSISLGLLLDWSIQTFEVDIQAQLENSSHFVPHWLEQFAALLLVILSVRAYLLKKKGDSCG
ncbi:MAG: hypothetical protein HOE61_14050 [Candidatus Marinimicrobia bacterium]|nr:hypothetical protein [Candidatus Neomarinimicrobiota bacterium]